MGNVVRPSKDHTSDAEISFMHEWRSTTRIARSAIPLQTFINLTKLIRNDVKQLRHSKNWGDQLDAEPHLYVH